MKGSIQKGRYPLVLALCMLVVSCSAQKKYLRPSLPDDARSETLTTLPNSTVTSLPEVEGLLTDETLSPPVGTASTGVAQQTGLSPPISGVLEPESTTEAVTLSTTATGSISGGSGNTTDVAAPSTTTSAVPIPTTLSAPSTTTLSTPIPSNATAPSTTTLAVPTPTSGAVPTIGTPSAGALPTTGTAPASGAVPTTLGMGPTASPVPTFSMMPSTSIDSATSNSTVIPPATNSSSLPTNNTVTGGVPPERQQPFLHRKVGIEDVANSSLVSLVPAAGEIPSYIGNNVLESWFEFEWNVPVPGFFDIYAGVASPEGAGSFSLIDMNTTLPYETFTGFNATMAWDTFASFSRQIEVLAPGLVTMRVETVAEGYNIQYLYLTPSVLRDAIEERDNDLV